MKKVLLSVVTVAAGFFGLSDKAVAQLSSLDGQLSQEITVTVGQIALLQWDGSPSDVSFTFDEGTNDLNSVVDGDDKVSTGWKEGGKIRVITNQSNWAVSATLDTDPSGIDVWAAADQSGTDETQLGTDEGYNLIQATSPGVSAYHSIYYKLHYDLSENPSANVTVNITVTENS